MNDFNRREFLSNAGKGLAASRLAPLAATLATSIASHARAQQAPTEKVGKPLGYALVGLGRLTINELLPALQQCKHSKCTALVSGDAEKAKKLATQFGVNEKSIYNYENYDKLADNPEVDVIYIVLPNGMHAEYTIRGFNAGKHVLCEKPMANSVAECQQMIDAGKQANKKLMIAYRVRHEPHHIRAIKMARDKELGTMKVITADAGFNMKLESSPWRFDKKLAGGGALLDIGIYALNACRFIVGEEPSAVNAVTYTPKDDPRYKEVEESTNFQLKFPSGVLANCSTSYSYAGVFRYRMICTDGWYELDPAISYRGIAMRMRKGGSGVQELKEPEINQFAAEMDHFSQCVMENKEALTAGDEGLKDMRVIEAIYKSANEGMTVKLS